MGFRSYWLVWSSCLAISAGLAAQQPKGTPSDSQPPPSESSSICMYSVERPNGGDSDYDLKDFGDDFAHARARGAAYSGEGRATSASLSAADADAMSWSLTHFPVPGCLPVRMNAEGRLFAAATARIETGPGVRSASIEGAQKLHSNVLGSIETNVPLRVALMQIAGTPPQNGVGPTITSSRSDGVSENKSKVLAKDRWCGAAGLILGVSSTTSEWAEAFVDNTSYSATTTSTCFVHGTHGAVSAGSPW